MTCPSAMRASVWLLLVGVVSVADAQSPADPYSYARTTSYTYYGSADGAKNGLLASETAEPDLASSCVTTSYGYDDKGNRTSVTTSNCQSSSGRALFASRTDSASYTGVSSQAITVEGASVNVLVPDGIFATSATNALLQSGSQTYDPRFGEGLRQTDANGLVVETQLDDFGRTIVKKLPDGTRSVTWYCVIGAGLDATSNSIISGVSCPTPAAGEAPADAVSFVHTEQRDGGGGIGTKMAPFSRAYMDRLGREIRIVTESFDGASQPAAKRGALVVRDVVYNAYGAKELETAPYFLSSGSSTTAGSSDRGITKTEYDVIGRAVRVYTVDADGSNAAVSFGSFGTRRAAVQTMAYSSLSVTMTNDKGFTRKEEKNPIGEVVRVTDATGGQLVRQFDAFGNLVTTKDALQNFVRLSYDVRGRKLQLNDPDAGVIDYCYDALGQLKAQQNATMRGAGATGQCPNVADSGTTATVVSGWTTLAYDKLGRTTHRIDPEYDSRWYFDTYASGAICNKGIGQLCESRTSHGVTRTIAYDNAGRVLNQRTDIASGPSFASAVAYDATTGKLASKTYPTGAQVAYQYTALGMFEKVLLAPSASVTPLPATVGGTPGSTVNLSASSLLWQAQTVNALGKTEQEYYGNGLTSRSSYDPANGRAATLTTGIGTGTSVLNHGYTWDSLGNLTGRNDHNGDGVTGAVTETFAYTDGLNRLTDYTVAAANIPGLNRSVALEYNVLGMVLHKSDVGTYTYVAQGDGVVRPHAVRSIAGTVTATYTYDANGNIQSSSSQKYRTLAYTSFNLPDSNTGAQGLAGTPKYTWGYDESHARFKETHVDASGTRTTWYLHPDNAGGLAFESETAPGGQTSQRHYVSVGGTRIGVLVSTAALPTLTAGQMAPAVLSSIALVKMEYWHQDHLGSLSATTDHQGTVTARYAYDPFGKRRQVDGNYDTAGNLVIDWSHQVNKGTDRGFTGHEHLDDIGLVHMNGRIYDPLIGRFLSADPNVTRPDVLQNYDRYSYVLNNPLNLTDPTGFDPCKTDVKGPGGCVNAVDAVADSMKHDSRSIAFASPGSATTLSFQVVGSLTATIDLSATQSTSQSMSAAGARTQQLGAQKTTAQQGHPDRRVDNLYLGDDAPLVVAGRAYGALVAYAYGVATADDELAQVAVDGMAENGPVLIETAVLVLTMGRGRAAPSARAEAVPPIKPGAAGGETSGKVFPDAIKQAAKSENPLSTCVYCRREGTATQVDHAVPRVRGGNATLENAQLTCPHCNASKGARDFPVNPPPGYRGEWPPAHWKR